MATLQSMLDSQMPASTGFHVGYYWKFHLLTDVIIWKMLKVTDNDKAQQYDENDIATSRNSGFVRTPDTVP